MMIAILVFCSSRVQAAQDGDYTYTVTAGKAQITKYTGSGRVVTIPSTLAGFPLTSIGNNAFYKCRGLTSISIPQGVTSIGINAFYNCTSLTTLSLPQGVTSIGDYAFSDCAGLTTLSLPQGVTSIGKGALSGCTGLTTIDLPQGITSISDEAFFNCTNLTTVSLPQGVASIGKGAFSGCSGLTALSLPQEVTSIGDEAFCDCTGLSTLNIPQGVTSIAWKAFFNCTGLTTINLPQGVTSIGDEAFCNCAGLTTLGLPQGVTNIGESAFRGCTSLNTFSLPQEITSIGDCAFSGCTGLTTISIPQGVTTIGGWAFDGCIGLTTIDFNSATTRIYNSYFTIPDATKIIGYAPSTAQTYASKYNRKFEVIDTVSLQNTAITTPATKLCYAVGDSLDITGLAVTGTYSDGSTNIESITTANISGFSSTSPAAIQILTITVGDKTASYQVEITATPVNLESIAITTPATKLSYTVGDSLDITGLAVTGTYSDGLTRPESITTTNISGFNSGSVAANQVLTITVGGKTTSYQVQITATPVNLQSIAITTPATKLSYTVGDSLDITGLAVTGTYSDGTTRIESITTANIMGFNSTVAMVDQVLTITLGAKTTTYKVQIVATPITPSTVTGVILYNITSSGIDISWNSVSGAKSYTIYRATSENGTYAKVKTLKTTSFKNTKLKPSTSYWYKITALTIEGESGYSIIQTATTLPQAPSGVKASALNSTSIILRWNGVEGKTYNVYRSTSQRGVYSKIIEGLDAPAYVDNDLTPRTTYWYNVTVLNSNGTESAPSTSVKALTAVR